MTDETLVVDLAVVGAGPAGRALAHRALAAGLRVAVVDPHPERPWTATYGMYSDDLPAWLDRDVVACAADSFTVFTPDERVVHRGYSVLHSARFRRALSIDGATVLATTAATLTDAVVVCADGTAVRATEVVDARGAATRDHPDRPRQTAAGAIVESTDRTVVLMDWRPAPGGGPASFSYRVPLGMDRRLVEETCLAGSPPIPVDRLALRNVARGAPDRVDEHVDFPLLTGARPWRRSGPLRFGAAGGLMNPATGYSVAQSLSAVDVVVRALTAGADPHGALWPRRARIAYTLRRVGLAALLGLSPTDLTTFFDAFFRIDPTAQRRYLSARDDAAGVIRAMWAVYVRLPVRLQITVARLSIVAAVGDVAVRDVAVRDVAVKTRS